MACKLDVTGLDPTCAANAQVTIKFVAANHTLKRVSLNATDLTASINPADQSVSFPVPAGQNSVTLVLFPAPAPEPIQIVEDCGGGLTQPIRSFGSGIYASVGFNILAG